ncbi:hypothetical protein niasHT_032274 [Heterodera trifolii]|uniref:Uncharacterized protein n=1 Tax=Heterodera trifolii TaxID=157864 RepID=A0ABD2HR31_9BILA
MLCDRLLRKIFGKNGFKYMPPNGHHARSCTFGTIFVNWRNAFTPDGKQKVRQLVTAFARITAFPYEKDQAVISRFQQLSLVNAEAEIDSLEPLQLVTVFNAFMESIKRPYCSKRSLVDALSHFSPDNPTVLPASDDQEEEHSKRLSEEVELVKMLMNPVAATSSENSKTAALSKGCKTTKFNADENKCNDKNGEKNNNDYDSEAEKGGDTVEENQIETEQQIENDDDKQQQMEAVNGEHIATQIPPPPPPAGVDDNAPAPPQIDPSDCAKNYGGILVSEQFGEQNGGQMETENVQSTSSPTTSSHPQRTNEVESLTIIDDGQFIALQFDHHDSHTNKLANLNAGWQCVVFYVCNVMSFLTGENYDTMVDLLTFWFVGDNNRDVKQALYCHMRDLFARNMRQQEQQAAEWRRRMAI